MYDFGMPASTAASRNHANPALRRRRVIAGLFLTGIVVGSTGAVTAFVFPGYALANDAEAALPTTGAPQLPLLREPLARVGEQTALVAAIPDVVNNLWLEAGISGFMDWQNADAVEAWTITYLDGVQPLPEGEGATAAKLPAIEVIVGQWSTTKAASAFLTARTKGIPTLDSGVVTIAESGQEVGKYLLILDQPEDVAKVAKDDLKLEEVPAGAQGIMWWRNGTVVIKAVGPIELLSDFYSGFPL